MRDLPDMDPQDRGDDTPSEPPASGRKADGGGPAPHLRQLIVDAHAEYPAFHLRELAALCYVAAGRRPSPHTIQRVLAQGPRPSRQGRRYPPYDRIGDPAEARLAVIRLHAEGWRVGAIADYLQVSRKTVQRTLARWVAEGVVGLDDKPRSRRRRALKTSLATVNAVRTLQENPELGAFRVQVALRRLGIRLSERTCGRLLALNRQLYALGRPRQGPQEAHEPKEMPFKAERRHHYWSVDIRYLDAPAVAARVYVITILENFSRAILASAVAPTQDLHAYLRVLRAAVRQHGTPEALVSDSGGVFLARDARAVYAALGIRKEQIARRQPWQNYIETQFNIQRRMADWHFARAQSWEELRAAHDRWVADFNYQQHWAHRERQDDRHSPAEVLGWVHGAPRTDAELDRIFRARSGRRIDASGYVRYRHWRLYAERGLARRTADLWLVGETLTIEHRDEPLSRFAVAFQPDKRHLRDVTAPHLLDHHFASPQPPLWPADAVDWHLIRRAPPYAPRRPRLHREGTAVVQLALPSE